MPSAETKGETELPGTSSVLRNPGIPGPGVPPGVPVRYTATNHHQCDRELPCSNCRFRNKESSCRYESSAPSRSQPHDPRPLRFDPPRPTTASPVASAAQKLNSTHLAAHPPPPPSDAVTRLRTRYKDLARQLPTGPLVDRLVDVYFRDVNWQYYPLDHADFRAQLVGWRRAPLHVFASAGPGALPVEERAFPALLFLVLANALLCVGDEPGGAFEALKYTGAMGLRDLAADYCESGEAVLGLLGRGGVSVTGVQAGLLRAMFLKTSVRIVEAVCC